MNKKPKVGGQALIEGVMMRCENKKAIAVRKQDGDIIVKKMTIDTSKQSKLRKLPIFRGMFSMVDSMVEGSKDLTYSADFFAEIPEDEDPGAFDKWMRKIFKDKAEAILTSISVIVAVMFSVGLFIILPTFLAKNNGPDTQRTIWLSLKEGGIKIIIFVGYMLAMSFIKDIRRVFQYHGAEHKSVFCNESGLPLTVENVKAQPRLHPRCGTTFLFIVMIVSIALFSVVGITNVWLRSLIKLLLFPIVAGVAYEFIRIAGNYQNWFTKIIMFPGLSLQYISTKEPDDSQIEVAIASINAALGIDGTTLQNYLIKKDGSIVEANNKGEAIVTETLKTVEV